MTYEVVSATDRDKWDMSLTVKCSPTFSIFGEATFRQFYGSGSCWREVVTDRFGDKKEVRAGETWSGWLHDAWNRELNRRLDERG